MVRNKTANASKASYLIFYFADYSRLTILIDDFSEKVKYKFID